MNKNSISCNIISTAKAIPYNLVSTNNMLSALGERVTPNLLTTISHLGVKNRNSAVYHFSEYLSGNIKRKLLTNTTELGTRAVKDCIESANINSSNINLLISITNTANRHLPCFGYEVLSNLPELFPRDINIINMENQGCSVLLKAFEIAQKYLAADPSKYAVVVASEIHTGFLPQLTAQQYFSLHDLKNQRDPQNLHNTMTLIESFLFGDGAIAFLLGHEPKFPAISTAMVHLTDLEKDDINLIYMNEGGLLQPVYSGFPNYIMTPGVPKQGAYYAEKSINLLLQKPDAYFTKVELADFYLIHTGSQKILNGICEKLQLENSSPKVAYSYEILRENGNLSSASVGFMIHKCIQEKKYGKALMISFGVGFSVSCGMIEFK